MYWQKNYQRSFSVNKLLTKKLVAKFSIRKISQTVLEKNIVVEKFLNTFLDYLL